MELNLESYSQSVSLVSLFTFLTVFDTASVKVGKYS